MPITDSWQAPPWLELPISTKQFSTGQSSLRGSWGVHEKLQLTAQVRTHIVCVRHSVIALFNGGNWCVVCSDSYHQGSRARSTVSSCIQYFGTEPHRTNRRLRFALENFFINSYFLLCWCVGCSVQPGPKMVALAPTYTITQRTKLVNARIG